MARPDRMIASVCAVLLALALVCAPALAQDGTPTSGSLKCKPVAFVLARRWQQFTSRSGDTAYVVMNQQPVVMDHSLTLVFGMDQTAHIAGDTSTTMTTLEFKDGSDRAITFGKPQTGRYMSANNPADEAMLRDLPTYFAPLRFDISVPWKMDTRRFTFVFRHASCPEQRIVYKYNPRGPLQPIVPDDVPVGDLDPVNPEPTNPTPTTPSNQEHCQLTSFAAASQWSCSPAFARGVYDYNCTAPSSAFLDTVTVQTASNFLALKLTADADTADESAVRGLVSGVESSSFPLLPGRNIVVVGAEWGGVCSAAYVFEVLRAQTPVSDKAVMAVANWRLGEFGACTGDCANGGTGSQTREVVCVIESGEVVDESRCTAVTPKPVASQTCQTSCDGINNGGGELALADSSAPSSSVVSPLVLLGSAVVALVALRQ